ARLRRDAAGLLRLLDDPAQERAEVLRELHRQGEDGRRPLRRRPARPHHRRRRQAGDARRLPEMKRAALIAGLLAAGAGTNGRAAPSAPPAAVSGMQTSKVEELKTILLSRNDNDPRLDLDFNGLNAADKRAFRKLYRDTKIEKRNERGTIVYLLGRNLTAPEDWKFLRDVALEPP